MSNFFKLLLCVTFITSNFPIICSEPKTNAKEIPSNIPSKIARQIQPYLIPDTHPMKKNLDAIFHGTRATQDESAFAHAGFITFSVRPRSHVVVARHPDLPGYVVKANLDNNAQLKQNKESWEWFKLRCEGAKKVREVIMKKNIKHFVVADKWIYPLPANPSPPLNPSYTRHLVILLATDMHLVPKKENLYAWKNKITTKHLDELYEIITHARGSSYRPDNINFTQEGTFAFIDTEYPDSKPDYTSIRRHLNIKMRAYWDKLVKNGGRRS